METPKYMRRREAGAYLRQKFGFGSARSLAIAASYGTGPLFHKAGKAALYEPAELDRWAVSKIGEPRRCTRKAEKARAPAPKGRKDGAVTAPCPVEAEG